ncbi:MAG: hypothetical protein II117_03930 [Clostridia bacterium]|nr:hypothetical protein [Clostridia bacterium]
MCVKECKRIVEREAKRYREHKAFIRGVEDARETVPERYRESVKWVLTVDYVLAYLHRVNEEKERFFRFYFGVDGERRRTDKGGMIALSFEFHTSASAMYAWRKEMRTLLVIAAAQTGALRPYGNGMNR